MNDEDLQHPRRSAEESNFLADVFERADPQVAAFMARHNALLERVTVLERAHEGIVEQATAGVVRKITADDALLRVRHLARKALDA